MVSGKKSQPQALPFTLSARLFVLVYIAVVSAVMVGAAFFFWKDWQDTEAHTTARLKGVAQIVDTHLDEVMRRIHAGLRQIALETPAEAFLARYAARYQNQVQDKLANLSRFFPEINSYRIYDDTGKCLYSSSRQCPVRTIEDRAYFKSAKSNPQQELHYSEVIRSRVSNNLVVSIAMPITNQAGQFIGLVNVGIDLQHFKTVLGNLNLGPHGAAALRSTRDLALIARLPEGEEAVNLPLQAGHPLWQWMQTGQQALLAHLSGLGDDVSRLYVIRRMAHYPFVIVAGESPQDYRQEWRSKLFSVALLALLFWTALGFRAIAFEA